MKNTRPLERIIAEQTSDWLKNQTRLSLLSWNAGPERGKVTSSVVDSFPVILLQEAQSHFQEIANVAEQQFHIFQGADQLIVFHGNTFEPDGVKTEGEIFGLKSLMVRSRLSKPPRQLDKGKMEIRRTDQTAHPLVHNLFCETRATKGVRGEAAIQYRTKRGKETPGENKEEGTNLRSVVVAASMTLTTFQP